MKNTSVAVICFGKFFNLIASKNLSKEFIDEKLESIYQHDVLLIEGYYLKENYDLCKFLCQEFKKQNKLVILTLSAVCIVQYHMDKIRESIIDIVKRRLNYYLI